ncbi:MAG: enoyl-CoA hydratase-related protein [Pseudomonadota bacterium]
MKPGIDLRVADEVATITINRPEKGNALRISDLSVLRDHLGELAEQPIRALVLTGTGDRAFSAGMDLTEVADPGQWTENPLTMFVQALASFPRPTIARLNGAVIGGSVEIAMNCDFRIGVTSTKVMVPAAKIGIHYEHGGLARCLAELGAHATRRIYLLAETLRAEELQACGFLNKVTEPSYLDHAVSRLTDQIRSLAPLAVNGMKQSIRELQQGEAAEAAEDRIRAAWASSDLKEGLAAAAEKRPPRFKSE